MSANVNRSKNQVMAGARHADRAGANQLQQRGQRLCRCDPGEAIARAQHQQRAGAGQAASGHQRPLPGRRNYPHRRGAGRSRPGGASAQRAKRRKATCRPRAARFSSSSACSRPDLVEPQPLNLPVKSEQEARRGHRQQPQRDHRVVQRCRGEGRDRRRVFRADAAAQPAGPDLPETTTSAPAHSSTTAIR